MRHGERADLLPNANFLKLKFGKYDSELTDLGKIQAKETGIKIKNMISKHFEIDNLNHLNIRILSSPFARCIQSANVLSKVLKLDKDKDIYIEYGLSEYLNPIKIELN